MITSLDGCGAPVGCASLCVRDSFVTDSTVPQDGNADIIVGWAEEEVWAAGHPKSKRLC